MRPGIGQNTACALGDCLTSRPKGCLWPRELWFLICIVNSMIESVIWGLIAQVTGTGKVQNCMRRTQVLFVLPVLVTRAINPILYIQPCYQLLIVQCT